MARKSLDCRTIPSERNSDHPSTTAFAKQLQEVTEGEASLRNLDVERLLRR